MSSETTTHIAGTHKVIPRAIAGEEPLKTNALDHDLCPAIGITSPWEDRTQGWSLVYGKANHILREGSCGAVVQ